ncbi:MAG: cytosine/creatinine deaminase [Actinomycetota bacterium]|nr:cytosine/creatinine deaminase [Actinomycetota bacterium]
MLIEAVRNGRVAGHDGLVDVVIAGGRIESIAPAGGAGPGASGLDAEGRAVLPGLVDAHVHLDKAYQLDALVDSGAPLGTLDEALAATAAVRRGLTTADRVAGAERLLARMVRHGTAAARVHVELDPGTGLAAVRWHVELAATWADRIDLQLVAFPQHGLFHDPEVPVLLEEALIAGCHVVGACPYADDDAARHVAHVAEVADRHGRLLDLHIDFTADPGVHDLDHVVEEARNRGWASGRVTLGHVTSLAAMTADDMGRRATALAAAGIGLVSLPATDTYLTGTVAPFRALIDAGVMVAVATNNVANAFTPYGDGSLLQVAWLAGLVGRFGPGAGHRALLDTVTTAPARLLGLPRYGLAPGADANLVVVDADRPEQAVVGPAEVVAACHQGRLTVGSAGPLPRRPR